uniref:Sialic acid-binding Ig-like lectin 10 n=1 Tax=Castor canadensis TaxID=51338 RepID=A0A8B7UYS4_CASCN|nr:sialic acid-binding Ig-like lectin 10 [Castor canadensis]
MNRNTRLPGSPAPLPGTPPPPKPILDPGNGRQCEMGPTPLSEVQSLPLAPLPLSAISSTKLWVVCVAYQGGDIPTIRAFLSVPLPDNCGPPWEHYCLLVTIYRTAGARSYCWSQSLAQNLLGTQHFSLSLSVHYPPQLLGPFCSWGAEGLTCSCSSRAWPPPSLRWWMGEALLDGDSSNASFTVTSSSAGTWANSSLSLHGGLSSGLRLSCEAWNVHRVQRATVLLLPDNGSISIAFSKGAFLGIGVTTLLSLCLVAIIVRMLRKKQTQAGTPRTKISRGSTILDYVNVVPKAGSPAQNQKAKPSSPPRTPSPGTRPPESKNRKDLPLVSLHYPESKPSSPALDSKNSSEELQYATLNFLRPWEMQRHKKACEEYAEIMFQRGSPQL